MKSNFHISCNEEWIRENMYKVSVWSNNGEFITPLVMSLLDFVLIE